MLRTITITHARLRVAVCPGFVASVDVDELLLEVDDNAAETARDHLECTMINAFPKTFPVAPANGAAKATSGGAGRADGMRGDRVRVNNAMRDGVS